MNWVYLLPYLVVLVGSILVRAARWQLLLEPVKRCSFWKLNSATLIGMMANNLLPARAGEFLRAYAGARLESLPFSTCLATAVIDRLFDGLTASGIFIFALMAYPLPDLAKLAGYGATAIYLATLALLVALVEWPEPTLRISGSLLRRLPERWATRAGGWLRAFVGGLGVFHRPGLLLGSIVLSIVVWVSYALGLYFMWLAFDIHLSLVGAFIVLLILTIGLTLPSTPGFVGAMEAAIIGGLVYFGVDKTQAAAAAIVYHVTQFVPYTIAGFVVLWLERITLADIAHVSEADAQPIQVQA